MALSGLAPCDAASDKLGASMSIETPEEISMLALINKERQFYEFGKLEFRDALIRAARSHSKWMLDRDIFSHTGVNGSNGYTRMRTAGWVFTGAWTWGENISWRSIRGAAGYFDEVKEMHAALMLSPGHRANILKARFKWIGIGLQLGDFTKDGRTWRSVMITQNFAG
jgi:uncharacterized protein YkwD